MIRLLTSATILFAAGSIANATIEHKLIINEQGVAFLEAHPGYGPGYMVFDLVVTVTDGDDWIATIATAILHEGEFFDHPMGGDGPFHDGFHFFTPELEYDSFYTTTEPGWKTPGFYGAVVNLPAYREATWFSAPPNGGEVVDNVIARYVLIAPDWDGTYSLGTLTGFSQTLLGGGTLYDFSLEFIPAPGSVALLGLAGLIGRRRR